MHTLKRFIFILIVSSLVASEPYVNDIILQKVAAKYNDFATKRFMLLEKNLDKLKDKSDLEKLTWVNTFYNRVPYASDMKAYGISDYWATPWEFLGKDMGDCEDYVIAKYFALVYLGFDSKKLFLSYVRAKNFKETHMVLTYFETPKSDPLVLDSNNHKIFPASQRADLTPIYNFNGDSLYKATGSGAGKNIENQKIHKNWDELKLNIKRNKV